MLTGASLRLCRHHANERKIKVMVMRQARIFIIMIFVVTSFDIRDGGYRRTLTSFITAVRSCRETRCNSRCNVQRAMIGLANGGLPPMILMLVIEERVDTQKVFQNIFSGSIEMIQSICCCGWSHA